ncbi:hypothetical protein HYW17_03325 [Candidatus Uhrbacteria bacterium]|nr:hypothetical protein [Candidatus Uhrbacteria bacterium]
MSGAPPTQSAQSKERLADVRDYLHGLAEWAEWASSGKAWMSIAEYQDWKRREIMREKKEMLYELKRRKWIETKTIGKRLVGRLTEAGWQMALRNRIRNEDKKCTSGNCFIIFDIPESQRYIRKLLRQFIKECGFKRLQHSVWITDKDVAKPLLLLLQRRKLNRWVQIIQGHVLTSSTIDTIRAIRTTANTNTSHLYHPTK